MTSPRYSRVQIPLETDQARALKECSELLQLAGDCLSGLYQISLFNKIKGLQPEVDTVRQQLLIPPAP